MIQNDSLFGLLDFGKGEEDPTDEQLELNLKNSLVIMPDRYANIGRFFNSVAEKDIKKKNKNGDKILNMTPMRFQCPVEDNDAE